MAALLKKRALAEYSQVIQEEPKQIKRLRLQHKDPVSELHLELRDKKPNDILQCLVGFQTRLHQIPGEAVGGLAGELMEHYHEEKEAVVRAKIVQLLGQLCLLPNFIPDLVVDHLIGALSTEKSHKAVCDIINALKVVGRNMPTSCFAYKSQIITSAKNHLSDSSHIVRSSCLDLLGMLWSNEWKAEGENHVDMQRLLARFTCDQDPRVRTSAFQAVLNFHQRGLQIDLSIYQPAWKAFSDDFEDVRLESMKVVWMLCHLFPESLVSVAEFSDDEIRLVDDGFAKLCNMINDISVKVRVEAASLLGSLHEVSPRFLEQTLDKKLMSNMRRKRSAHERAKEHFQTGEWSTGQKWADDAPKEEIEAENISLMNIGACGAFVHGTEDEFYEVRNAALDSLCELAAQSRSFANLSQDSIIDMFNDEIESVRLNAINSLRKISHYIVLRQDQLEIILGVLQDFSEITRRSLHEMLCDMILSTKECLKDTVLELLNNLQRYPQDKQSVWKCCRSLGKNHPQLCLTLAQELLCVHPYFNTPVPDMDDPAYICILILMFNAGEHTPTLMSLLPPHTLKHYEYILNSQPALVPKIQAYDRKRFKSMSVERENKGLLSECVSHLTTLASMDNSTATQLLRTIVRDLEKTEGLDINVSTSAECICSFLQTQLFLTQIISQMESCVGNLTASDNILAPIEKMLELTTKLQTLYIGLGNVELGLIKQTELKAITLQLRVTLSKSSLVDQFRATEAYKKYLSQINTFMTSNSISLDNFTKKLLSNLETFDSTELNYVRNLIQSTLPLIRPVSFPASGSVRKACATINEPTPGASDNPVNFAAGLTTVVTFDATVDNFSDVQKLKIRVCYPDQQIQLLTPSATKWKKLGSLRHHLRTEVVLSHALWSEPCYIEINLVLEPNLPGKSFSKKQDTVSLCAPVEVYLATKPPKR